MSRYAVEIARMRHARAGGQGSRARVSRYAVEIARRVIKSIAGLPRQEQHRVRAAIDLLADEPRPPYSVALAGEESAHRWVSATTGSCMRSSMSAW